MMASFSNTHITTFVIISVGISQAQYASNDIYNHYSQFLDSGNDHTSSISRGIHASSDGLTYHFGSFESATNTRNDGNVQTTDRTSRCHDKLRDDDCGVLSSYPGSTAAALSNVELFGSRAKKGVLNPANFEAVLSLNPASLDAYLLAELFPDPHQLLVLVDLLEGTYASGSPRYEREQTDNYHKNYIPRTTWNTKPTPTTVHFTQQSSYPSTISGSATKSSKGQLIEIRRASNGEKSQRRKLTSNTSKNTRKLSVKTSRAMSYPGFLNHGHSNNKWRRGHSRYRATKVGGWDARFSSKRRGLSVKPSHIKTSRAGRHTGQKNIKSIISFMKGFHVIGGIRYKTRTLISCQTICETMPFCFAGDFNHHTKACYLHNYQTACGTLKANKKTIHFKKVPCGLPGVSAVPGKAELNLGRQYFRGIELPYINSFQACVKRCSVAGLGVGASLADRSCLGLDFDFSSRRCFVYGRLEHICGDQSVNAVNPNVVNVRFCQA